MISRTILLRVALLTLGLSSGCAFAGFWYVDKDARGANTGVSWSNAWSTFAAVRWGSGGVQPGDTLYISGGATAKEYATSDNRWTVGVNGTSNAPITIRVGQEPGHNGCVVFNYDYLGDFASNGAIRVGAWTFLDGEVNGTSHWHFKNLRSITTRELAVLSSWNPHGLRVQYLSFSNCNTGLRMVRPDGNAVKVQHCTFRQMRGDAAIAILGGGGSLNESNQISHNYIELAYSTNRAPGSSSAYSGPDGIQIGSFSRIYSNVFRVVQVTNIVTSTQHPDYLQLTGSNIDVYCNEFINIGDSAIDFDLYWTKQLSDIRIFNNLFRIEDKVDPYPEYIRMYSSTTNAIESVRRFYVWNNTFLDSTNASAVLRFGPWNNPGFRGYFEIFNNVFYNCGRDAWRQIWAFWGTSNDWPRSYMSDIRIAGNVYHNDKENAGYVSICGTLYTVSDWVARVGIETNALAAKPIFADYVMHGVSNNLRPSIQDRVLCGNGLDLSGRFAFDMDGKPRDTIFDRGAYRKPSIPARVPAVRVLP